eukprot:19155_1
MNVFKLSLWLSLLCLYTVGTYTDASCLEHRERGCSKDDDCCGELICKDIALTYFLGKQHYCMKRHDPLGDTTPVRRGTQYNLRATGLNLHAENVDFVAQHPRKLRAEDPVEKVLQGTLDTKEDIRDKMNEASTKPDGLIRAAACVIGRQVQAVTDDRIGTIESAFEDMKTYLPANVTLSADEALALSERVQNAMENLGNTLVHESGTFNPVIQCLSEYANDASNLVEYRACVERQTFKSTILPAMLAAMQDLLAALARSIKQ